MQSWFRTKGSIDRVAEVFVVLLAADPESILSVPATRPTLTGPKFGISDLFAVVERNKRRG